MEYIDKVLAYLLDKIKPGTRVEVVRIAEVPQKFVDTVKELIDQGFISCNEFEFTGDYKFLKRL